MSGRQVAYDVVGSYQKMFDLSLSREKLMDMMPGLFIFLARRPEMAEPALQTILPLMRDMGIEINHDLLIEMMPSLVKAVDQEPELEAAIFRRMALMVNALNIRMNLRVMRSAMGMVMGMSLRHPRSIPAMMLVMPKMIDYSFLSSFVEGMIQFRAKIEAVLKLSSLINRNEAGFEPSPDSLI